MKRRSIDRIGMRGSLALLILGTLLFAYGLFIHLQSLKLPENAIECKAVITGFKAPVMDDENPLTFVKYTVDGKEYTDVPLGQYEGSWNVGEIIDIYCSSEDNLHIWTRTMQYRGIFYISFSIPILMIAIYKLIQFRKIKGVNDNESDIDDSGEEKFKISSAIIPLLAGIPFTINGIFFGIMEKKSILALIIITMGAAATLTGITSIVHYIEYKNSQRKTAKAERLQNNEISENE